jgi:hypothetical protein
VAFPVHFSNSEFLLVSSPGKSAKCVFALDDRAIQHAAAYRFNHRRLWHTGSPAGACHRAAVRPTRWRAMTFISAVTEILSP